MKKSDFNNAYSLNEALKRIEAMSTDDTKKGYYPKFHWLPFVNDVGSWILLCGRHVNCSYELVAHPLKYKDGEPVFYPASGEAETVCKICYNTLTHDSAGFSIDVWKDWYNYVKTNNFETKPPKGRHYQEEIITYEDRTAWEW